MGRWFGWELVLVLLPLFLAYGFKAYRDQHAPSIGDILGSGQALLIAIAWSGGSLRELREAPEQRGGHRDVVTFAGTCFLLLSAAAYGFIASDLLAGRPQTPAQAREVAIASLVVLAFAGLTSMYAVAIGTREAKKS